MTLTGANTPHFSDRPESKIHRVTILDSTGWHIEGNRIIFSDSKKYLHPSHQMLYELALRLHPKSVFECGFGGGDHLGNLSLLLPGAVLARFARERNGARLGAAHIMVVDFTDPACSGGIASAYRSSGYA